MNKTNWKRVHEKILNKTHQPPHGWDSREYVASQLQCSPDKVSQVLGPGIKAGEIEVKVFSIWDKNIKRVVQRNFYRENEEFRVFIEQMGLYSGIMGRFHFPLKKPLRNVT